MTIDNGTKLVIRRLRKIADDLESGEALYPVVKVDGEPPPGSFPDEFTRVLTITYRVGPHVTPQEKRG